VVTSRSQVRPYSASRMRTVFGTFTETSDQARRYNDRIEAYNRIVKNVMQTAGGCSTPKSVGTSVKVGTKILGTPTTARRTSLGSSEWKKIREENARMRTMETVNSRPRTRSVKTVQTLEVQRIIQNLNRVKSLLESSP